MTIRKDIGVSEIISLLALLLSGLAFWYSTQANNAYIVGGGGVISYATIQHNDKCSYIMTIPVDFHNSGKEAVSLEQLAPAENLSTIIFSNKKEILDSKEIKYHLYLSNSNMNKFSNLWITQFKNAKEFEPSYSHIKDLIEPGQRYGFYIVIIIDSVSELKKYSDLVALFSIRAIFSNNQEIPINAAIQVETQSLKECS